MLLLLWCWFQCSDDCLYDNVSGFLRHMMCVSQRIVCGRCTSSKTSFNLYCVSALHSTYLTAPRSFAILSPSSFLTGVIFCFPSFSLTLGSSRRSVWVPTMRHGTPGQWWWTSGNHFSRTFSKEAGDVTEKQTRKTSV